MRQHLLGVIAIFKNETMNLVEWIEHYVWQGATKIYLLDNNSDDKPLIILKQYIDRGLVHYTMAATPNAQLAHYRSIYPKVKTECAWCVIADLDEFWFGSSMKLADLLLTETADVIVSPWRMFGSSGHIAHPPSIRKALIHAWPLSEQTQVKYIFRTHLIEAEQIFVHFLLLNNRRQRIRQRFDNEKYILNHYAIQSLEFFTRVKMTRGDVESVHNPRNMSYFRAYDQKATTIDKRLSEALVQQGL